MWLVWAGEWNSATHLVIQQMRGPNMSPHHRVPTISVCPGLEGISESHYCQNQGGSQANRDKLLPHYHSSFLISSSKTVPYLTSCCKVALANLWLSFFLFCLVFFFGNSQCWWVGLRSLIQTSVSSCVCVASVNWKHLQLYEFGKCWMRYVIIMMHRK